MYKAREKYVGETSTNWYNYPLTNNYSSNCLFSLDWWILLNIMVRLFRERSKLFGNECENNLSNQQVVREWMREQLVKSTRGVLNYIYVTCFSVRSCISSWRLEVWLCLVSSTARNWLYQNGVATFEFRKMVQLIACTGELQRKNLDKFLYKSLLEVAICTRIVLWCPHFTGFLKEMKLYWRRALGHLAMSFYVVYFGTKNKKILFSLLR